MKSEILFNPPVFLPNTAVLPAHCYSREVHESDEEFDARWVTYFNKPDIDAWELRKGMLDNPSAPSPLQV